LSREPLASHPLLTPLGLFFSAAKPGIRGRPAFFARLSSAQRKQEFDAALTKCSKRKSTQRKQVSSKSSSKEHATQASEFEVALTKCSKRRARSASK
jgi:hypothetical protein